MQLDTALQFNELNMQNERRIPHNILDTTFWKEHVFDVMEAGPLNVSRETAFHSWSLCRTSLIIVICSSTT